MPNDEQLTPAVSLESAPQPPARGPGGRFIGGHQPGAGRRPGGLSKRTAESLRIAEDLGFQPVRLMIEVILGMGLPEKDGTRTPVPLIERLRLLKECSHYLVPKIHSMEITGRDGGAIEHAHVHVDVSRLLQIPGAAEAAETLQLALLEQGEDGTVTIDPRCDLVP